MSRPWRIAIAVVAVLAIALLAGGGYTVLRYKTYYSMTDSMAPTIVTHQMFVVDRFAYHGGPPRRGEVVFFTPPVRADNGYFKRVVAVPGDRLVIRGGRTFVNGVRVDEPYAPQHTGYDLAVRNYGITVDGDRLDPAVAVIPPRVQWTAPDTVPRGCYVVLGDNRNNSQDSHAFGFFCPGQPVPGEPNVHVDLAGRAIIP